MTLWPCGQSVYNPGASGSSDMPAAEESSVRIATIWLRSAVSGSPIELALSLLLDESA